MHRTPHALGDRRELLLKSREVDEGTHQGGNLDVRSIDEGLDECLERWERLLEW